MTWEVVETALTNVWSIVSSCVTFITGQPVMLTLFAASLVPIGFKIFRKAKKAVR